DLNAELYPIAAISVGPKMACVISMKYSSPPRKRGSRATVIPLAPWVPASAGMTDNLLIFRDSFRVRFLASGLCSRGVKSNFAHLAVLHGRNRPRLDAIDTAEVGGATRTL